MRRKGRAELITGLFILGFFVLMALFPGLFTHYGRKELFDVWLSPSAAHLLGTNSLGYDVFTELVSGAGDTLLTGLASSALTLAAGTIIGTIASKKNAAGMLCSGVINVFMLLPRTIVLIVLSSFFGTGRGSVIVLIAAFSWVGTARAVRAQVSHIYAQPFIEACVVRGYSGARIAFRHILPNLSGVLLSRFLLGVNSCIMMESTLSFLGLGDLYHPTWGTMIDIAYRRGAFMRGAYAYLLAPGVCIMLLSLSFYLVSIWFSSGKENVR